MDGSGAAQRVGALIAACLAGGAATLALATPAYAEDADLRLEIRSGQLDLKTDGDAQVLRLAVINDGPSPVSSAVANVQAPLAGRGVTIGNTSHSCSALGPSAIACQLGAMNPGQTIDVTVELKPPGEGAVQPGENVNENGNALVTNPAGGDPNNGNDGGQFTATLSAGEQQGGEVNEVSGQVADGDSGQPLEGATVEVTDSTGRTGSTTTDGDGRFKYLAEPPLQAGRITVKATKAGYETTRTTVDAAGGSVNDVQLAVSKAEAAPPPTPTAAPTTAPPSPAAAAAADDDDSSSLLVVILVSAIATTILAGAALWIGLRRNRDNEPAYAGDMGFQPPARPVNLDAPTVQLRLPDVGGGTRVMPTLGSPESDATQQIPLPDNTQLGYPPAGTPIAYDQTAPFGPPPTTQLSPQAGTGSDPTAMFSPPGAAPYSAPPGSGPFSAPPAGAVPEPTAMFSPPPGAAPVSPPGAGPFPPPSATPVSPPGAGPFPPPASTPEPFSPPASAPDLYAPLPDLPRRDPTPRDEPQFPEPSLARPFVPPHNADRRPGGPRHSDPLPRPPRHSDPLPSPPRHSDPLSGPPRHADPLPSPPSAASPPASPEPPQDLAAKYRGPFDPTPTSSTVLRFTQTPPPAPTAQPGPSPLSTQDGARPPITALQTPLTSGALPRLSEGKDDEEQR